MHAFGSSRICRPLLLISFFAALMLAPCCCAQSTSAIWSHGALSLSLPYHASHAGAGRLVVELLSPENDVLAQAERSEEAAAGDGTWNQELSPPHSLSFDELIWERVRWSFRYDGETAPAFEQIRSISTILRRPILQILGQTSYLAGAQAAIRIIVSDDNASSTDVARIPSGTVRVDLLDANRRPRPIFSGHLDRRGTTEADFRFPAGLTGDRALRFLAETPLGAVEATENVHIENKASILLTTEKPIYQPSQTIHMRALALDRSSGRAAVGRQLTFEVEDARGNKVFRKSTTTDGFGIASAAFTLADEVNLGAYHVHALLGDRESPSDTAELTLNVQRYALPKFRVAMDFAAKDGKPQRDYRPGDHVVGVVHANYFFGKPVDHAPIVIKASGMDVAEFEAASAKGQTDASGDYHFDLRLPGFFAGSGLAQGAAPVLIEATVKDAAGHAETHGESITVSRSPLLVMAVPESGVLVPGIENRVYVLTSSPDGAPAQSELTVRADGMHTTRTATDPSGVAVIQLKPSAGNETLHIDADDHHGNRISTTVELQSRTGEDQILLRTNRALYKPGDALDISVLSTRQHGGAYIDLIRNGQTMLTRDVDLANGRADLSVRVTPEMAGTLTIDAYVFGSNSQAIADRRLVFVQPADDLHIEATADAASYLPGAESRVHFHVTNARGEGVAAALGLEVVDEAVFALAEKQPGFAKVFFYLERELMKPRYEIHSLSPSHIVEPIDPIQPGQAEQQDRDACVLLAAAQTVDPHTMNARAGNELPQDELASYTERYTAAFTDYVRTLAPKLSDAAMRHSGEDLPHLFAALADNQSQSPHDAWGMPLRLEPTGWAGGRDRYYRVRSAGPDRQFDTPDDLTVTIEARNGTVVGGGRGDSVAVRLEHDRGPMNGLAAISGSTTDPSGAVIPGASVRVRPIGGGPLRRSVADADGRFSFAALEPGRYEVLISAPGFASASHQIALGARDLAVLDAVLAVGAVSQSVEVINANTILPLDATGRDFAFTAGPVMQMAASAPRGGIIGGLASAISEKAPAQQAEAAATPHVRSYFPEALYINPEILTDGNGNATIGIPLADSITTWRMAMFASTAAGALGTGSSSLKVFQDFFVDLDLPVTLTQGDRVSIPVAVYNYSGHKGDVTLSLQPDDWYTLAGDAAEKSVAVDSGQVGGSQFTIQVQRIGKFKLTLSAGMNGGAGRQDTVTREIEVVPNGREQDIVFNGRLDSTVQHTVAFPAPAISGASKIFVRLYPGPLSQVVDGMDSILSMPGGCFEQTSSSTYPNVLALDYMKRNHKLTPEVRAKAEGYIATGYQRLLTFEVPGGGFSWFGQTPANKILTAYGLMEFHDMSQVYDVDPALIARTRDWLVSQQQPDGSWKPDTQFINEGATNRFNSDVLRITAYIAWSLETAGDAGPAVSKAKDYIADHLDAKEDAYTLAVLANFAASGDKDSELTHHILQMLVDAHSEKGDLAWWSSEETSVFATGESAAVETTGLAVQALLRTGESPEVARKSLAWILSKKGADSNWGTTQATIMALRALLLASDHAAGDAQGTIDVLLDGKSAGTLAVTSENNDLLHQFVLPTFADNPSQNVEIRFAGSGEMAYQVVGRYFVPWQSVPAREALSIDVAYDRTKLAQNDIVAATATIRNNLRQTANMVMVDLGIPPGFDLLSEELQSIVDKTADAHAGRLEKFSLTATQAILYFDSIAPGEVVKLPFRLRAKYPIRAKNFMSRVYEYYDPAVSATAPPTEFEVTQR